MIERHQDYLITVPSVPVGGVTQQPIKLDTDAPFALRLVRSRNIENTANAFLNGWRFTTPRQAYQSNALRSDWVAPVEQGGTVYPGRGSIVFPELIYQPGSTINVDIGNLTDGALTNAQLLFRGSKIYSDASRRVPTYPPKCSLERADYQVVVKGVPQSGQVLNVQFQVKNDADFVYQYGAVDAWDAATGETQDYTNLFVQLKDESGKFFSNAPIHANDLFGLGFGTTSQDDLMLWTPGLVSPEIYIPRRHSIYFDIYRTDVSGGSIDLYFRFCGWKVFER